MVVPKAPLGDDPLVALPVLAGAAVGHVRMALPPKGAPPLLASAAPLTIAECPLMFQALLWTPAELAPLTGPKLVLAQRHNAILLAPSVVACVLAGMPGFLLPMEIDMTEMVAGARALATGDLAMRASQLIVDEEMLLRPVTENRDLLDARRAGLKLEIDRSKAAGEPHGTLTVLAAREALPSVAEELDATKWDADGAHTRRLLGAPEIKTGTCVIWCFFFHPSTS